MKFKKYLLFSVVSILLSVEFYSYAGFEYTKGDRSFKEDAAMGVLANRPELDDLAADLVKPQAKGYLIETLNYGGGTMTTKPNLFAKKMIRQAISFKKPILEIGTAYGVTAIPLLEYSSTQVIANDISPENLLLLRNEVAEEDRDRLFLNTDRFPGELSLSDGSLSGILICRVFHFLRSEKIEEGLRKAYQWLEDGGIIVITTASPFQKPSKHFIDEYQKRFSEGMKWPGYVEDYGQNYELSSNIDSFIHVMDIPVLSRALEEAGFEIMEATYLDNRKYLPQVALDGREATAIMAKKVVHKKDEL